MELFASFLQNSRLYFILLGIFFSSAICKQTYAQVPLSGTGEADTPYLIENLEDLRWISEGGSDSTDNQTRWSYHYRMVNDIDAADTKDWNEGEGFSPIGADGNAFTGVFDGAGNTISNLYINRPNSENVGFISSAWLGSKIENIGLINLDITARKYIGGLVANPNNSVIENCFTHGKIKGQSHIGGLCNYAFRSSLINSFSNVNITGNNDIGGLLCSIGSSTLKYCYASGQINGKSDLGGIVVNRNKSSVSSTYWDKETTGVATSELSNDEFGLVTEAFADIDHFYDFDFSNHWEIALLTELDSVHRPYLKSFLYDKSIKVFPSIPNTTQTISGNGETQVGAEVNLHFTPKSGYRFIAWETKGGEELSSENPYSFTFEENSPTDYIAKVEESYSFEGGNGSVHAPYQIASLEQLAYLSNVESLRKNKYYELINDIDASPTKEWNNGKGFKPIGYLDTLSFNGNYHTIKGLYINRKESYVGLFGFLRQGEIKNVRLEDCEIYGTDLVGGLIGYFSDSYGHSTIQNCEVSGKITAKHFVSGGIAGSLYNTDIINCYSFADVLGKEVVGGVVASIGGEGLMKNCYAAGLVEGEDRVGGILPTIDKELIQYSYWDSETTTQPKELSNTAINKGLLTPEFADPRNFKTWDFDADWEIRTVGEHQRPALMGFYYDRILQASSNRPEGIKRVLGIGGKNIGDTVKIEVIISGGFRVNQLTDEHGNTLSNTNVYEFVLQNDSPTQFYIHLEEDISFAGGTGTRNNPYQIENLAQLEQLSYFPHLWNQHFILIDDIDASSTAFANKGAGFKPIGQIEPFFTGSFDGGNHIIKGLTIYRPLDSEIGLFGKIVGGEVVNLGMENVAVSGSKFVGGLVGYFDEGTLNSSYVTGTVSGEEYNIGGILGACSEVNFSNCFSNTEVTGDRSVGGLVGSLWNWTVPIYNLYQIGAVKGRDNYNAGLISGNYYNTDKGHHVYHTNYNAETEYTPYVYPINGLEADEFSDLNNFVDWDKFDQWEVRLINDIDSVSRPYLKRFLYHNWLDVSTNYEMGIERITGTALLEEGGEYTIEAILKPGYTFEKWIDGEGNELSTTNPYAFTYTSTSSTKLIAVLSESYQFDEGTGDENSPYHITTVEQLRYLANNSSLWDKHFILMNDLDLSESNQWDNGQGLSPIGHLGIPFSGYFDGNEHFIKNLYINRPNKSFVGLFGYLKNATVNKLGLTNTTVTGKNKVGAIVGELYDAEVSECLVHGEVHGQLDVGGIVGATVRDQSSVRLYTSQALVDVHGKQQVGGAVGRHTSYQTLSLSRVYAAGIVSGEEPLGGIVGATSSTQELYSWGSYWDVDYSGVTNTVDKAEGLSTEDFSDLANLSGFDSTSWIIATKTEFDQVPRPYLYWLFPKITASSSNVGWGKVEGEGHFLEGSEVQLVSMPEEGFYVKEWLLNGEVVGTDSILTINVTDDAHYEAVFDRVTLDIDIEVIGNGYVSLSDTTLDYGSSLTLNIEANDQNYELKEVIVNGNSLGEIYYYNFWGIKEDLHIKIEFKELELFNVKIEVEGHGNVSMSDTVVHYGTPLFFEFTPDEGYELNEVILNGDTLDNSLYLNVWQVTEDQNLKVGFREIVTSAENKNEIKVFPNPVSEGKLTLQNIPFGSVVVLFDVSAREVFRKEVNKEEDYINTMSLPIGVYYLIVKPRDSEKGFAQKIIIE
ncbi:InlB B-repeat-containing protein [Sediminitomix flava]|uniref:Putative secreted protein (Por secretion system target) n=1 Tax=Sediminitomix flava TaxID=379075 RepID=A0A315ZDK2_SEDFL|nr:T9SS type A sorting domain-containing protein [Sediminitomix flava]PWJ43203.1 putative secreted protein (Por secretion system target) [Sediminitomix flava]